MAEEFGSLRPPGSVEVRCGHPGCGVCWWIDPLDPRLPDGPFDCGDDHESTAIVRRRLSLLRLRHGLRWGTMIPLGPERGSGVCGGRSASKGAVFLYGREYHNATKGLLTWDAVAELADVDAIPVRVQWDPSEWPTSIREAELPGYVDQPGPGEIRWVGYQTAMGSVRRYTFVKCARPGCPHDLMVDVRDPAFRPEGHAVGSWGGGTMPQPEWWGKKTFRCEDGLSTFGTQPCALIQSDALAQFEMASKARWTVWEEAKGSEAVLFFDPLENRYGVFFYKGAEDFSTSGRVAQGIRWGSLSELERLIRAQLPPTCFSSLLDEITLHTKLPS